MKMKIGIRAFILTFLIATYAIFTHLPLKAQVDAALLPNAIQQFFDNNGNPLTSGKVYFYEVGTTTFKTTWRDATGAVANSNPIILNAAGRPPGGSGIYGEGTYRQVVRDRNDNLIWDAVTVPGGGGTTPTSVGDGNLVGTVLPWAGLVAPNQYVFAYGQEISRSTYDTFYTAITQQLNVICTSASNVLTGVSDTTQIKVGSTVELSCTVAGTTVVSKTASTVTLSNPSSVSINVVATFFPWGNGNGSTTFNVPDYRGVALAGRPNMGGTDRANITTTYFGTNPAALGAEGGLENSTLLQVNLPSVSLTTTILDSGTGTNSFSGGTGVNAGGAALLSSNSVSNVTAHTFTGTTPTGGTNTPFSRIQPTTTINYVIKITPDTSTSIATGVYSIGGMTGVIACGTGLLCTGNTISVSAVTSPGGSNTQVQFNNSGVFGGSANLTWVSPALTIGVAGSTTGQLKLTGATSGTATLTSQATAGTPTITFGTSSGTPAVTASAPLTLTTATGNIAITGAAGQILAGATPAFTATPTLGASGTLGSMTFGNATSGLATIQPVAGALGTVTISIPSATGTMAVSATSPLALNATTGALTCTGCLTNTPAALTRVDDTNVTITLGGTPATALLQATSLTMGWTGTLAAGRLNANVVQAITNDTNVTGSIAAQNLTLGWTGTLAAARLNANVVQSIVNDTNVTGSIAAQALTLAWSGQLSLARGGSSQTTAPTARSSAGFNIDACTSTGDANYTILSTNRCYYHTALSSPRTDTLPAANSVNAGQVLYIVDFAGQIVTPNTLTIQRAGADTINGSTSTTITSQYGAGIFWSDGTSRWTFFPVSAAGGAGTVTSVATTGGITGGTITTSGTIALGQTHPGGRLTLTSNTPYLAADATAQTTIYYTPAITDLIPIYDGSAVWTTKIFTQLSVAMAANAAWASGSVYDWFVVNDSGTLRLCSGPAWTSVTGRGTGAGTTQITLTNGIYLNTVSMTCRYATGSTVTAGALTATYVGTMYATANGTTAMQFKLAAGAGGSAPVLGLYNAYNRSLVTSVNYDSTNSMACSSATWAIIDTTSTITWVDGLQQSEVIGGIMVTVNPAAGNSASAGLGLDWSSGAPVVATYAVQGAALSVIYTNTLEEPFLPQLGKHTITGIMACSSTATFYGDGALGIPTSYMLLKVMM